MPTERRAHSYHCGLIVNIYIATAAFESVSTVCTIVLVLPESRVTRLPLVYVKGDQQ